MATLRFFRPFKVRFASTNAPESRKRGLTPDRWKRVRRLFAFYVNHGIDIGSVQEAGTYAKAVDPEVGKIKTVWAKANSIVRGREVGNGVFVNRLRFKVRKLDDIDVGDLHVAVVRIKHRLSGFTWTHIAIHRRTRRDDPTGEDRLAMNILVRQFIKDLERNGQAWSLAGDANEGDQWALTRLGVGLGIQGVDHIRASEHFAPVTQRVFDKPALSDHDFLVADARVTHAAAA